MILFILRKNKKLCFLTQQKMKKKHGWILLFRKESVFSFHFCVHQKKKKTFNDKANVNWKLLCWRNKYLNLSVQMKQREAAFASVCAETGSSREDVRGHQRSATPGRHDGGFPANRSRLRPHGCQLGFCQEMCSEPAGEECVCVCVSSRGISLKLHSNVTSANTNTDPHSCSSARSSFSHLWWKHGCYGEWSPIRNPPQKKKKKA